MDCFARRRRWPLRKLFSITTQFVQDSFMRRPFPLMRAPLLLILLLVLAASGWAGPARVAVVSNAAAVGTGLEDLLTVSLSKEPELAVVERSKLAAVANEQALVGLLSTRADRTQFGKLVAADFLLI